MVGPPATVAQRIEHRLAGARIKTLIVGAGIAGATCAALLARRGEPVAVVERSSGPPGGYMLGLMPLGGRVLNGLDLGEAYHDVSVEMRHFALHDRRGELIRSYPLNPIVDRFGSWRGIERGALLGLLRSAAGPIEYDTTVTAIADGGARDAGVTVTFDDGSRSTFDLLIAADGLHSHTRSMILRPDEVSGYDTGWGGFVVWSTPDSQPIDTYREQWSSGWGVGLYPVPGRLGMFLAGRGADLRRHDAESYATEIAGRLEPGPFAETLAARDDAGFYWEMADRRAHAWWRGRAVLLGDAATGFLPTAGVGASAAMDSAAALADELSRVDADHVGAALALFETRQRARVEGMQGDSRRLARVMFLDSEPLTWARDQLLRLYTTGMMQRSLSRMNP